jgi:hypothetical protein
MVNVIRRFTVAETPIPRFKKVQTSDGFYDVSFWHHVQIDESEQENIPLGDIIISSPVGGKLYCCVEFGERNLFYKSTRLSERIQLGRLELGDDRFLIFR